MKKKTLNNLKRVCLISWMFGLLTSCENSDNVNRLEESIQSKEETLADVEERIVKEKKALEENQALKNTGDRYQDVLKKLEDIEAELKVEQGKSKEARAGVKTASLNFINYRNQYRRSQRARAKGTTIDLSATKGAEYKDVRISRITPLELRVLLSSGPKGIPFHELPLNVQERFQFSEEEAMAYQNAVAKVRIAQAKNNQVVDADKQVEQATARATEISALIEEKKSLIASINRRIKSKQLEAERLESLARHWRTEENNARGQGRSVAAKSRAVKLGDQADKIRLGIASAKQSVSDLRHDIGQLLKNP